MADHLLFICKRVLKLYSIASARYNIPQYIYKMPYVLSGCLSETEAADEIPFSLIISSIYLFSLKNKNRHSLNQTLTFLDGNLIKIKAPQIACVGLV